jgi:hypothetical protein
MVTCGDPVACQIRRPIAPAGGRTRRTWLWVSGAAALLGACGAAGGEVDGTAVGPGETPAPPDDSGLPTALQAVAIAAPQLRQRHPAGVVIQLSGTTRRSEREWGAVVREWVVDVWAPERGRSLQYTVIAGALHETATSSTVGPGGLPPIMPLAAERVPEDLVDSDRALALADAAGAAAFKRESGGQLRTMSLLGRLDGTLRWKIFYSRLNSGNVALKVELDGQTGAVTRLEDERLTPVPTRQTR